ncbi:hypothetical protein EXIGLDRAFT_253519 [Exidia glandulosa HHB12029]|uniref:Uncharacterized protein n=1 Tax=Exidia glandulosa HHB12029 TaxID=1314781 RepID=A0A165DXT7_EXIGL|nr:hypothetical protein EXIGLDRAFT_253519 [Exidia glandulosa HHB12029]
MATVTPHARQGQFLRGARAQPAPEHSAWTQAIVQDEVRGRCGFVYGIGAGAPERVAPSPSPGRVVPSRLARRVVETAGTRARRDSPGEGRAELTRSVSSYLGRRARSQSLVCKIGAGAQTYDGDAKEAARAGARYPLTGRAVGRDSEGGWRGGGRGGRGESAGIRHSALTTLFLRQMQDR